MPNALIFVAKCPRACYLARQRAAIAIQGHGVSDGEELDLARAMIRLYGADAENVAAGHAETHAEMGDLIKSDKWRRIAAGVAELRVQTRAPN